MNLNISFSKLFIALLFLGLTQTSCDKEPLILEDDFSKGIFIVNEGPFQNGTGTITHISTDYSVITRSVFETQNNNAPLGNIVQSMIKLGESYYIAVNNGSKIIIVNAKTFVQSGEIKNIASPRYFATNGTKLYVSAHGENFSNGAVYEINTKDNTLSAPIAVGNSPENIVILDNKLYVTIGSPFGANSKSIKVIDITTNKVTNTIEVGDNPTAIVVDKTKNIWVLCSGDYTVPPLVSDGGLYQITGEKVVKQYKLPQNVTRLAIDNNAQKLFFIGTEGVYSQNLSDSFYTNNIELVGTFYGLGFDAKSNSLLATNPRDFQSKGVVSILNYTTNKIDQRDAGIIPGFVYVSE